jgi:hypothetical protein
LLVTVDGRTVSVMRITPDATVVNPAPPPATIPAVIFPTTAVVTVTDGLTGASATVNVPATCP